MEATMKDKQSEQKTLRILIADDEPLIRMDLRELLEESGYEVVAEAKDGQEAVDFALEEVPDLIFLDIRMPNMDGIEAAQTIQNQLDCKVPIIMLTAYSQPELYERAASAGIFAYLTKPLRKADLAPAIQVALARASEIGDLYDEAETLKDKLETRKLVEKAKGQLMKRLGLDEETAMRNLQKAAMNQGASIKQIALSILESKS